MSFFDFSYLDMFDFVVFDTVELLEMITVGCNPDKRRYVEVV